MAQPVKNLPAIRRPGFNSWVGKISWRSEYPLQYSCWRIPWTDELDGLQSTGSQRVWHDWVTNTVIGIMAMPACLVMSNSLWPYGLWHTRLLCPWDFPGKNTEVDCISFSRGSSRPRDQILISCVSCIAGGFFLPAEPPGKPHRYNSLCFLKPK